MCVGIKCIGWGYGQIVLVCVIQYELFYYGVVYQFFMFSGFLVILFLSGNCSLIVWFEIVENVVVIYVFSDDDYFVVLWFCFGDFFGEILLVGVWFIYLLGLSVVNDFVVFCIVLVGDVVYGLYFIVGQGLNVGLCDVVVLVEVLSDVKLCGEDFVVIDVLECY